MAKVLMKGNEAVGKAAIEAGCRYFFGYPITPQSEVPEYLSEELPKVGGVFVQAESEVAAINMVYGAAAAGARVLTSSSSPGIALKQEGIGYLSNANLPAVIINMMRGGPGLGTIQPGQADYNMCVKGGSNGDYQNIVLAPSTVQEAVDMVIEAFDLADYYLIPVIILSDGLIGQMMEPVEFKPAPPRNLPEKTWALTGKGDGEKHMIVNLTLEAIECEKQNLKLQEKYRAIEENEQAWEDYCMEDAEYAFVAYGTSARIVKTSIDALREQGYKVGLIRPKTLYPFPEKAFANTSHIKKFMTVEMSMGQMVHDVKIACNDKEKVVFYGRAGGVILTPEEVVEFGKSVMGGDK
ncbi:MAG: 3-methyl-2-oxobutanoate dehydrogenase subunit VorB [Epulopiscium sp.]|nr:3-methyl-2-oxobutanoate dehydrogenase subunit VorB [Candidatus Epulonipiscium sp.]